MHAIRSRFRKLEDEFDDMRMVELMMAETTFMKDVIKLILNNGTLDACSLSLETPFPEEEELEGVVDNLFVLTSIFYFVSDASS